MLSTAQRHLIRPPDTADLPLIKTRPCMYVALIAETDPDGTAATAADEALVRREDDELPHAGFRADRRADGPMATEYGVIELHSTQKTGNAKSARHWMNEEGVLDLAVRARHSNSPCRFQAQWRCWRSQTAGAGDSSRPATFIASPPSPRRMQTPQALLPSDSLRRRSTQYRAKQANTGAGERPKVAQQ